MKKIIPIMLLCAVALGGCKEKKDMSGLINAGIAVNGQTTVSKIMPGESTSDPAPGEMSPEDSVKFVVKYAFEWHSTAVRRGFTNQDRDFERNRLMFYGIDVMLDETMLGAMITDDSQYDMVFVVAYTKDGILYPSKPWVSNDIVGFDTVAYIPNEVLFRARREIKAAFAEQDYERCFSLFDKAFIFVPTTGPKWRALKAAGIE